jgi:hypothetical protein
MLWPRRSTDSWRTDSASGAIPPAAAPKVSLCSGTSAQSRDRMHTAWISRCCAGLYDDFYRPGDTRGSNRVAG